MADHGRHYNKTMNRNLSKKILEAGGEIFPLILPGDKTGGTGLMNPSILNDGGKLLMNLRHVNYTLYHCENQQIFYSQYGPLAYLNPEDDLHLRTINYLCELDENFNIQRADQINTSKLDKDPLWDFVGLEDARLVRWDGRLFDIGVRRDTTTNGQGRMELSELFTGDFFTNETNRYRIQPPKDFNSYCEKNWVPIIDMPFHFVKWANPTEIVKVNLEDLSSETVFLSDQVKLLPKDLRGGSQVIPFEGGYLGIFHEVNLWKNKLLQKDATYTHKFVVWDRSWQIRHVSDSFSFMTGEIEFCCGLAKYNDTYLVTFGFQDNAAYLLVIPETAINAIVYET